MNIRLIAMDLDGTLLQSDKSISKRTVDALLRCKEKGIKIALVTARSYHSSVRAKELVKADILVVNGGAEIRDGDKTLLSLTLQKELADEVIAFALKLPSFYRVTAETCDGRYLVSRAIEHGGKGDYTHAEQFDFTKPFETDMYKLVIYLKNQEDKNALKDRYPNLTIFPYVGTDASFVGHHDALKWSGLKRAAELLGIEPSEIVVFGDDAHDIEMIKKSGVGVAMGNAIDECKAAADVVTASTDDDGIAVWLENNLL